MIEKPPTLENSPEHVPTSEEVRSVFEQLIEGKEFVEVRKCEDAKGLYLWDIKATNADGESTEFSYMRQGRYPEGQAHKTAIHVTFFNNEGMPVGGHSAAKYVNGEWDIFS